MFRKCLFLVTVVLIAATIVFAQGTFTPRDADEDHAWRIYSKYRESKKNEDQLTGQIAILRRDITNSSHSSVGVFGSDARDRAHLTKMREQLTAEQAKLRKLEADWDRKFYGRYGHLRDSNESIVDPVTKKKMDKIEFRLINFPFNDAKKKVPEPTNPTAGGSWKKVREKLWTNTSTPNDPDSRHEQSGAPYEITYVFDYYDRNGTQRWLKDTSHVSCKLDLLNADRVAPGQKVNVRCSMSYKAERYKHGGDASLWVGDLPIQTPGGFKSDGTLYPLWGYRTDAVLRVHSRQQQHRSSDGAILIPDQTKN